MRITAWTILQTLSDNLYSRRFEGSFLTKKRLQWSLSVHLNRFAVLISYMIYFKKNCDQNVCFSPAIRSLFFVILVSRSQIIYFTIIRLKETQKIMGFILGAWKTLLISCSSYNAHNLLCVIIISDASANTRSISLLVD